MSGFDVPSPTMETLPPTDIDPEAALMAEKIAPYLEAAEKHGLHLRPITGLMLRLGDQFGIDLIAVGELQDGAGEDADAERIQTYYDELMDAVWLLCETEDTLVAIAAEGGSAAKSACLRWKLSHLTSQAAEAAAMRAFIGRWWQHRYEMARLYGAGEAAPADA